MLRKWQCEDIENSADHHRIPVRRLSNPEIEDVRSLIEKRFLVPGIASIWQRVIDHHCSFQDPLAWKSVSSLVGDRQAFLIFWDALGWYGYSIAGEHVSKLLSSSSFSEFAVVDHDVECLVVFNDHDYLIGVGEAFRLVEKLRKSPQTLELDDS